MENITSRSDCIPPECDAELTPSGRARTARILLATFWTSVVLYLGMASLPESPMRPRLWIRLNLGTLSPQGWAFFTRNPREAFDRVYRRTPEGWSLLSQPNTSWFSGFGLSRRARVIGVEMAPLLARIPAGRWIDCDGDWTSCAEGKGEPLRAINRSLTGEVCGDLAIVREEPVPWAWSRTMRRQSMPSRLALLRVSCEPRPVETAAGRL
jgi:antimicrobial peptide system SdpA family protein